jgi:hypothetical protein
MPYRALLLAAAIFMLPLSHPSARAQAPDPARLAAAKEMMQVLASQAVRGGDAGPAAAAFAGFIGSDKAQEIHKSSVSSAASSTARGYADRPGRHHGAEQLSVEFTAVIGFRSPRA